MCAYAKPDLRKKHAWTVPSRYFQIACWHRQLYGSSKGNGQKLVVQTAAPCPGAGCHDGAGGADAGCGDRARSPRRRHRLLLRNGQRRQRLLLHQLQLHGLWLRWASLQKTCCLQCTTFVHMDCQVSSSYFRHISSIGVEKPQERPHARTGLGLEAELTKGNCTKYHALRGAIGGMQVSCHGLQNVQPVPVLVHQMQPTIH